MHPPCHDLPRRHRQRAALPVLLPAVVPELLLARFQRLQVVLLAAEQLLVLLADNGVRRRKRRDCRRKRRGTTGPRVADPHPGSRARSRGQRHPRGPEPGRRGAVPRGRRRRRCLSASARVQLAQGPARHARLLPSSEGDEDFGLVAFLPGCLVRRGSIGRALVVPEVMLGEARGVGVRLLRAAVADGRAGGANPSRPTGVLSRVRVVRQVRAVAPVCRERVRLRCLPGAMLCVKRRAPGRPAGALAVSRGRIPRCPAGDTGSRPRGRACLRIWAAAAQLVGVIPRWPGRRAGPAGPCQHRGARPVRRRQVSTVG